MSKRFGFLLPLAFAGSFLFGFASCDEAENALDCNSICDKYKDCWNKDYDEGACRNNCRDKANSDSGFEAKVDQCAACIEDKSCVAGSFSCATECVGIVP